MSRSELTGKLREYGTILAIAAQLIAAGIGYGRLQGQVDSIGTQVSKIDGKVDRLVWVVARHTPAPTDEQIKADRK